jgi:ribosomal protein S18 acetylase RimI-like enzyme
MYQIVIDHDPSQADNALLREGLVSFYEKIIGEPRDREYSVFLKNDAGKIVGGLLAHFDIESVYIETFWVDEKFRNQGFGTKLLDAAEQEAIKNGCVFSTLDTFDFQAEAFYKKCGYERMGEIKNYFFDHSRIFLRKKLKRENNELSST